MRFTSPMKRHSRRSFLRMAREVRAVDVAGSAGESTMQCNMTLKKTLTVGAPDTI